MTQHKRRHFIARLAAGAVGVGAAGAGPLQTQAEASSSASPYADPDKLRALIATRLLNTLQGVHKTQNGRYSTLEALVSDPAFADGLQQINAQHSLPVLNLDAVRDQSVDLVTGYQVRHR